MTSSRTPRRYILWVLLALVPAAGLVYFAIDRRRTIVETLLRDWASGQVAEATDSVYQLAVSGVELSLFPGRIVIDSISLVTDTARNDFRATPLPVLKAKATGCGLRGVRVWGLLMGRGVNARLLRCEEIRTEVLEEVRHRAPAKPAAETPNSMLLLVSDSIHLPGSVPVIVVHGTELPRVSIDYTRRSGDSSEVHLTLERLALTLRETRIDPSVPRKARRPLFSEQAIVTALALDVLGERDRVVKLGRLRADLTDSTLALDSIVIGPWQSDAEWVKLQKQRRDLIRIQLDSARFRGVDYRRLGSIEGALVANRVDLFDLQVHVTTDKDLPAGVKKRRRSPQQAVAGLDRPLQIDTLMISGGRIAYTEHGAGKPASGTMTWEKVQAEIVNLKSPSPTAVATPPVVITASALLLGQGKLDLTIEIPLAAPRFDMKYSGSLGPMDMTALNAFAEPVLGAKVSGGTAQSVRFSVVVTDGRSVGHITPLYRDFKLQLTDKKAGFIKKAGLAIVSLFANTFKIRGDNPNKPDEAPVVGRINRPYSVTASLPQLFWFALKEGLGKVFLK